MIFHLRFFVSSLIRVGIPWCFVYKKPSHRCVIRPCIYFCVHVVRQKRLIEGEREASWWWCWMGFKIWSKWPLYKKREPWRERRKRKISRPNTRDGLLSESTAKSVCVKALRRAFYPFLPANPPPSDGALKRFAKSRVSSFAFRIALFPSVASEIKLCVSAMSHAFMFLFSVHLDWVRCESEREREKERAQCGFTPQHAYPLSAAAIKPFSLVPCKINTECIWKKNSTLLHKRNNWEHWLKKIKNFRPK